jgi:GH24 family phage-related lysozyme (muramidase)
MTCLTAFPSTRMPCQSEVEDSIDAYSSMLLSQYGRQNALSNGWAFAPRRAAPVRRAPPARAPVRRAPVARAPVRRAPVRRAPAPKRAVAKRPVKRAVAKRPVKRAVAKRPVKRAVAKRPVKRAVAKRPAVKRAVRKTTPRRSVKKSVRKAAPRKAVKRVAAKAIKRVAAKAIKRARDAKGRFAARKTIKRARDAKGRFAKSVIRARDAKGRFASKVSAKAKAASKQQRAAALKQAKQLEGKIHDIAKNAEKLPPAERAKVAAAMEDATKSMAAAEKAGADAVLNNAVQSVPTPAPAAPAADPHAAAAPGAAPAAAPGAAPAADPHAAAAPGAADPHAAAAPGAADPHAAAAAAPAHADAHAAAPAAPAAPAAALPAGDFTAKIRAMVATNEGRKAHVYIDTKGHPTIGVGYNLDKSGARQELASLGLNYDALRSGAQSLTEAQIDAVFDKSLSSAMACTKQNHPGFNTYPQNVQLVATDMTFNLGCQGARWPHFIKQLESKDYRGAAANMRGTPYCGQVGGRCTRNQALLTSAH